MQTNIVLLSSNIKRIDSLSRFLLSENAVQLLCKTNENEALQFLLEENDGPPKVLIYDLDGAEKYLEVIRVLSYCMPSLPILVLDSHETIERCGQAIEAGATDFLIMPFYPLQVRTALRNAMLRYHIIASIQEHKPRGILRLNELEAQSSSLLGVLFLAREMARTQSHIVLQGSNGMGYEMFAHAIHMDSANYRDPFEVFNAALHVEHQVLPLLFGQEKAPGLLERVGKGTLFLRHLDYLNPAMLARLLSVVRQEVPINPRRSPAYFEGRVIVGMERVFNRDETPSNINPLLTEPFYTQLNGLVLSLPAFMTIREDIPYFVDRLCERYAAEEGRSILRIHPGVYNLLMKPGQLCSFEQMAAAVYSAVMHCKGTELVEEDFEPYFMLTGAEIIQFALHRKAKPKPVVMSPIMRDGPAGNQLICTDTDGNVKPLTQVEEELIRFALARYSGHMSDVAKHLGIGRSTLYRKLSSMKLPEEDSTI